VNAYDLLNSAQFKVDLQILPVKVPVIKFKWLESSEAMGACIEKLCGKLSSSTVNPIHHLTYPLIESQPEIDRKKICSGTGSLPNY
jgi:hypothetical protein